jgi:uncharacterized protein with von Willebrand factor type A (vWA) domain
MVSNQGVNGEFLGIFAKEDCQPRLPWLDPRPRKRWMGYSTSIAVCLLHTARRIMHSLLTLDVLSYAGASSASDPPRGYRDSASIQ